MSAVVTELTLKISFYICTYISVTVAGTGRPFQSLEARYNVSTSLGRLVELRHDLIAGEQLRS